MVTLNKPRTVDLNASVQACLTNGNRLLDDALMLEFQEPSSSRYYIAMIAQEEFAKAFLLLLVRDDVVPFSAQLLRAMSDHACKQLVGMILDYVISHCETIDELDAMVAADRELGDDQFPTEIASALQLLRYEKIGRWESNRWSWVEDPEYDKYAVAVAQGGRDRVKQGALYVRIGKDGRVVSSPIDWQSERTREEVNRADRYRGFIERALEGGEQSLRYERIISALQWLFTQSV